MDSFSGICYGMNYVPLPPTFFVEVLIPNVTVFGDRALKDLKLNEVIEMNPKLISLEKIGDLGTDGYRGKTIWEHSKRAIARQEERPLQKPHLLSP
jgi:hypothetical protein